MIHTKRFHAILALAASLFAWMFAPSCTRHRGGHDDRDDHVLWFVHATDPHIYKEPVGDSKDKPKLQKLDEEALSALFQKVSDLSSSHGSPAFLLITGDFGVDPCLIPNAATKDKKGKTAQDCLNGIDSPKRAAQIDNFAELLSKSPVRDIFFVAGNNDLPLESATEKALAYFNAFFAEVQTKITEKKSDVRLYNLTGCYADSDIAGYPCYKDVDNYPYRVIGFPSQSFKNKDGDEASNDESKKLEVKQVKLFESILDQAVRADKKIIIVTHIPELDDPFLLGQAYYANEKPADAAQAGKDNPKPAVSAWNVKDEVLESWKTAVASHAVLAVFAGHLHDSHKEIYAPPYAWSTQDDSRIALNKLLLAPPLSLKKQDTSVIQARGFSTVTLTRGHVETRFYWYDGKNKQFNPEPRLEFAHSDRARLLTRVLGCFFWMWELDQNDGPLERFAVLLIALLASFLTVIAVWQIPPSDNPLAKRPDDDKGPKRRADDKSSAKASPESTPFTTKFGKTVIAGLGGLIFTEIAKMIGNRKPSDDANYFYLVWFIVFFFLLLIFFSLSRGIAEAIRSRVAVIYYPLARRPHIPRNIGGNRGESTQSSSVRPWWSPFVVWLARWYWRIADWLARWYWRIADWLGYWILRVVNWVFSLKVPALTFFDTFINLVQGKNQTTTRALEEVVIDQQKNLIRVADAIRKNLNNLIESKMGKADRSESKTENQKGHSSLPRVRVNISVLSADQATVFYVARAPGSSLRPFSKRSVAWISVFTGQIRWWAAGFDKDKDENKNKNKPDILLFDNRKGIIADAEDKILLSTYFQDRSGDYGGFVVIPLPWPQRSYGSKYVKGAIHISFRGERDIYKIWDEDHIQPKVPDPPIDSLLAYPKPYKMLEEWCTESDVGAALQNSIVALGELLFGFNEIIYKNYIEPDQKD